MKVRTLCDGQGTTESLASASNWVCDVEQVVFSFIVYFLISMEIYILPKLQQLL